MAGADVTATPLRHRDGFDSAPAPAPEQLDPVDLADNAPSTGFDYEGKHYRGRAS